MIQIEKLYDRAEELLRFSIEHVESDPFISESISALWLIRATRIEFEMDMTLTRCAGKARNTGQVKLSWPIFQHEENYVEFADIVLHEVAHVMAGCEHGHTAEFWGVCCSVIGCTGKVYHTMSRFKKQQQLTREQKASQIRSSLEELEDDPLMEGFEL